MVRFFVTIFSSGFGAGYVPIGQGTAGSLVGCAIFFLFKEMSVPLYLITVLSFVIFSVWISARAEILYGKKDDPRIVIDEIAGMLLGLFAMPADLKFFVAGFLFFRFFDILKIFPANLAQSRLNGGFAVVMDDVVAGIYTNISLQLLNAFI